MIGAWKFINMSMENILKQVEQFIIEKHAAKKWVAGKDWVQYAGPYFDTEEYTESIKTMLEGWLVLGENGIRFEQIFPRLVNKNFGILTNSGSSSNLLMMSALTSKRLTNFPKGTKVITPIAGFPTTINPIFQVGFEPVFVDIDGVEHIIPDVMKSDDDIGWEVGYEVFDIINDILNDEVVPYVGYQLTTY